MQNCAAGALIWRGCGLRYRLSADWPHPGGPMRQFYHFRCLGQSWKHYCRKRPLGQQTALETPRGPCCEDSEGWSPENTGTRGSGGHRTGLSDSPSTSICSVLCRPCPFSFIPHPVTPSPWSEQLLATNCMPCSANHFKPTHPLSHSLICSASSFWASARISHVKLPCLTEYDYKNGCVIWFDLIYAAHTSIHLLMH